jgi:hypothetical protein
MKVDVSSTKKHGRGGDGEAQKKIKVMTSSMK